MIDEILRTLGLGKDQEERPDPNAGRDQELAAWYTDTWPQVKNAYQVYHSKVWTAFLMYAGVLWFEWDAARKTFQETQPDQEGTPQPKINRFAPAIDSITSNVKTVPEIEAVPDKDNHDVRSLGVADIASRLAQYFIKDAALRTDYKNDEDKAGMAGQILTLAGSCFIENYTQPEKIGDRPLTEARPAFQLHCVACDQAPVVPEPVTECPTCGSPIEPIPTSQEAPVIDEETGQPATEPVFHFLQRARIVEPQCVLPRPGSRSMDNTPYLFVAERLTCDEIFERFQIEAEPDSHFLDGYSTQYSNALTFYLVGSNEVAAKDSALLVRVFIEPGKMRKFQDGCVAYFLQDKLVKTDDWPATGEHPITKCDYNQIPTLFFGRSVGWDLTELQYESQTYESIIKLHALTTAADPIVVDESTMVSEISGMGDTLIKWKSLGPGSKEPHHMGHGSLDSGVYAQLEALKGEFQNISGAVSVFRGQQEGNIEAAAAISQLREQAELMFAGPVDNWRALWKEVVRKGVKAYQKSLTVQQITEIVGQDKLAQVELFKQYDLDKLEWIAAGGGSGKTRAEKKEEMVQMFDLGVLDPADPNVKQKIFELFGESGLMRTFNEDATRARMENARMKDGEQVQLMPDFEDLETHLAIHLSQIKSLDFDAWDENARTILMQHTLETKMAIAEAMAPVGGPNEKTDPNTGAAPGAARRAAAGQPKAGL